MTELAAILAARETERAARRPCVLATVVGTEGSTYRRPGARMLVDADGTRRAGSISGGCLEGDLLAAAWERTAPGRPPALVHYDTRRDADALFGHGTGCQGRVSVLLERLEPQPSPDVLDALGATVGRERRPAVLAHVLGKGPGRGQRLLWDGVTVAADTFTNRSAAETVRQAAVAAWRARRSAWENVAGVGVVFLEHVAPPPSLTLYGTGPDAAFVLRLAKTQGWHVAVGGPRAAGVEAALAGADRLVFGSANRLAAELLPEPGGAALLMTHSYLSDLLLLERLVEAPVRYLGILGPRARREKLLADLAKRVPPSPPAAAHLARVLHAPAGLDLGTDGPEGIALAVVAEIQAVLAQGRCAGHLRESLGPLHEPAGRFGGESPDGDPDANLNPSPACSLPVSPALS